MLKKFFLIVMIVALAAGGYCYIQKGGKKKIYTVSKTTSSAKVSSVANTSGKMTVKREHVVRKYGPYNSTMLCYPEIDATIDMPVGNSALALSVKKWIVNYFFSNYASEVRVNVDKVSKNSAAEIINTFVKYLKKEGAGSYMNMNCSIKKVYETSKLVTFEVDGSYCLMYPGSDFPITGGATFRKSDGKIMGKSLVKKSPALMTLVLEASEYDENTITCKIEDMPMPDDGLRVVKEGILFLYGFYEITGCRGDTPKAIIPIETIYPYLTEEGKELLK